MNHSRSLSISSKRKVRLWPHWRVMLCLLGALALVTLPHTAYAEPSEEAVLVFLETVEGLGGEALRRKAVEAGFDGLGEMISSIPVTDLTGAATAYYEGDAAGTRRWLHSGLAKAIASKAASAGTTVVLGAGATAAAPISAGILAAVMADLAVGHLYTGIDLHEADLRERHRERSRESLSDFQRHWRSIQDQQYAHMSWLLEREHIEGAQWAFNEHRASLSSWIDWAETRYYEVEVQEYRDTTGTLLGRGLARVTPIVFGNEFMEFLAAESRSAYYRRHVYLRALRDEWDRLFPELSPFEEAGTPSPVSADYPKTVEYRHPYEGHTLVTLEYAVRGATITDVQRDTDGHILKVELSGTVHAGDTITVEARGTSPSILPQIQEDRPPDKVRWAKVDVSIRQGSWRGTYRASDEKDYPPGGSGEVAAALTVKASGEAPEDRVDDTVRVEVVSEMSTSASRVALGFRIQVNAVFAVIDH